MITLGSRVRCEITGFEGIATGRCEYLTAGAQVQVQPAVDAEGKYVAAEWIAESRLETLDHELWPSAEPD